MTLANLHILNYELATVIKFEQRVHTSQGGVHRHNHVFTSLLRGHMTVKSQHLQLWMDNGLQIWAADTAFGEESAGHSCRVTGKIIIKWSLDPDKFQYLWLSINYDH